ncbi:hypothetical protein [Micromonospora tarapacensis]|uniref:hypothetical protein n=1 Tax=Micromonospora tarapacensis TaxID=2835305 RepID=UPI001E532058|nr:hypothetical protein [Micromonospora tarapacensis]
MQHGRAPQLPLAPPERRVLKWVGERGRRRFGKGGGSGAGWLTGTSASTGAGVRRTGGFVVGSAGITASYWYVRQVTRPSTAIRASGTSRPTANVRPPCCHQGLARNSHGPGTWRRQVSSTHCQPMRSTPTPVSAITGVPVRVRQNSRISHAVIPDRLASRSVVGSGGIPGRACSATLARVKGNSSVQRARSTSRAVRAPEVNCPQLYASTTIGSSGVAVGER